MLLLHGWGADIRSLSPVYNHLSRSFTVFVPDLPGFGKSQEPPEPWDITYYAKFVREFCRYTAIENPIVIGHSNGGRIAICLLGKLGFEAKKLILVGSTGIISKKNLKTRTRILGFKIAKAALSLPPFKARGAETIERMRNRYASPDYLAASPKMRRCMSLALSENVRPYISNINIPTLLLWGDNDTSAPVSGAKVMEKLLPDAGLVVFKDAGHFPFIDKGREFILVLDSFLKNDAI